MKKIVLLFLVFTLTQSVYSYSWQSYGPEGIKATNLFFRYQDLDQPTIIFSDSGMFVATDTQQKSWEYYDYPAKDAVELNSTTFLFVAGDGSYSDGIYTFHLPSSQINVVENILNPEFISYDEETGNYYVGHENGLLKSENGLSWEAVPYFEGKNCIGIEICYTHLVVNVLAGVSHVYFSNDSGENWQESSYSPLWISSMAFRGDCKLYGVFPDNSYSSGLWSSEDYGNAWVNEFYSFDMNVVNNAQWESFMLVGWTNSVNEYEGIALYDPDVPPPGLIFLNETLPNKNINNAFYRMQMCMGATLFVCTDNGVYSCWDYFVGIDELEKGNTSINIYPNPILNHTTLKINHSELSNKVTSIYILNNKGQKVYEIKVDSNNSNEMIINWSKGDLPAGLYYLVIETGKEQISEKFIIL